MLAYLDLPSGLSGDMFLSCLVDAGWPIEQLRQAVGRLHLPAEEFAIESAGVMKGPLRATHVRVRAIATRHQRNLGDIEKILDRSDLPATVKQNAGAVFQTLAGAEAKVHGTTVEQVHFHEVGAVDAIVDIVGVCAGLAALGIDQLHASALPMGSGWTTAAHGKLPLPAPATLEILSAAKAPVRPAPGDGELVTPTGAALLATLATFTQPAMTLQRVAIGSGTKDFPWPNVARLWLGEPIDRPAPMVQIDTNLDDMNPQLFPVVMEQLLQAGAADVWLTPVQMKKGRPGCVISVLAGAGLEQSLSELLLRQTSTLGVRVHGVHRHEADRSMETVATPFGEVRVKVKRLNGRRVSATPEFEDCRRLAAETSVPAIDVHRAAVAAIESAVPPTPFLSGERSDS